MKQRTPALNQTTVLPAALTDILGVEKDIRFKVGFKKSNRKQERKHSRVQKKENANKFRAKRLEYVANKGKGMTSSAHEVAVATKIKIIEVKTEKKIKAKIEPTITKLSKKQSDAKLTKQIEKLKENNPALYNLLASQRLVAGGTTVEDDEGMYYERKLKIKKGELGKGFKEDGLDFLLGLTPETGGDFDETEFPQHDSDIEMSDNSDIGSEEEIDMPPASGSDSEMENGSMQGSDIEDDASGISQDLEMQEMNSSIESDNELEMMSEKETPVALEGKYIPPHLKNKTLIVEATQVKSQIQPIDASQDPNNSRLRKQIQGLLNRLSDATLNSIVAGITDLYSSNPRHSVTDITISLLLAYVGNAANLHDSFICTYAAFIACLHSTVKEFSAAFIQTIVAKLDYVSPTSESKCSLNFTSLISFLYNFSQINHVLIYDLIRKLLENLTEGNVEALLRILKISGGKLRSDDPSALKEIIILVNEKKLENIRYNHFNVSVRTKFMVEFIMELKNNKKNKMEANPIQFERLKKSIASYLVSKSTYSAEPLGCKLSDLLSSNGKWWVVGSAWKGRDDVPESTQKPINNQLAKLAQSLKMNTESRKMVFYSLMSASDFHDATIKILKLNLKGTPQRDAVRVPLYCLVHESSYNPFYTLVIEQLLTSRTNQISFQYAVWDHFKSLTKKQAMNLAQCLAALIKVVPLTVLKPLEFAKLTKEQLALVSTLLLGLMKGGDEPFTEINHEGVKNGILMVLARLGKELEGDEEMCLKIRHVSKLL